MTVLLLKLSFLCTDERYERLHPRGHLRRVHVLAERLQGMHAAHIAAGGKKGSQTQVHAWFVFDRDYCGPATINPVSIHRPAARMPWDGNGPALRTGVCEQCRKRYEPQRSSSRFCSQACRQRAHRKRCLALRLALRPRPHPTYRLNHRTPRKCFATSDTLRFRGSRRKAGSCCLHSMAHTTVSTRC